MAYETNESNVSKGPRRNPATRTAVPRAEQGIQQVFGSGTQPGLRQPEPYQYAAYSNQAPQGHSLRTGANEWGPGQAAPIPRKGSSSGGGQPPHHRKPFPIWTVPVIMMCLGLLAIAGWYAQQQYARYQQFLVVRDKVNRDVFYQNTFVDGMDISGMTLPQAEELLLEQSNRKSEALAISIAHGDKRWRIDSSQVPVGSDHAGALRRAYAIGRSGGLKERYAEILRAEQNGFHIHSEWGYDRQKVRELTDLVASRITQPARDARLSAFDPNARTFLFEPEATGLEADAEALYTDVTAALDAQQYDAQVEVRVATVEPKVRQADIEPLFGRISSFSTTTTKDQNRNTNISLSAQAIHGRMVLPGESLSFNECTGQRTQEKGYREAGAISGGQLIDETGGGVCQTSSTLFNAVVRADLEIVTRSQHSWPSTYVPRGEDAAVDWPRLDFKFTNNQDTPIFIVAWYAEQEVAVEVYGKKLSRTIGLESTTVESKQPSDEVIYTRSYDLAAGTSKVAKQKRTGYVVDTFKVYYQNGVEVERTKLWRTQYKPVQKEIYFN